MKTILSEYDWSMIKINDVFKAVDIASSINPSKLAINALKVSIKDVGRSMSL